MAKNTLTLTEQMYYILDYLLKMQATISEDSVGALTYKAKYLTAKSKK